MWQELGCARVRRDKQEMLYGREAHATQNQLGEAIGQGVVGARTGTALVHPLGPDSPPSADRLVDGAPRLMRAAGVLWTSGRQQVRVGEAAAIQIRRLERLQETETDHERDGDPPLQRSTGGADPNIRHRHHVQASYQYEMSAFLPTPSPTDEVPSSSAAGAVPRYRWELPSSQGGRPTRRSPRSHVPSKLATGAPCAISESSTTARGNTAAREPPVAVASQLIATGSGSPSHRARVHHVGTDLSFFRDSRQPGPMPTL